MNTFKDLYEFINMAKTNRKYALSTANNLKSALKIFEKELTPNELTAIDIVEQNIEEIFVTVINKNKDKDLSSLSTYKARILKVITDYKRFGRNPSHMQNWVVHHRSPQHSTPTVKNQDKQDKNKITLSAHTPNPVESTNNSHRIELSLHSGTATILVPNNIKPEEIKLVKNILDSFTR